MSVEALRIDSDDLTFDLIPEIERSFGVELPRDLRHIFTVGDLHALVLDLSPGVTGEACGTVIAFHLLRRELAKHGLDPRAGPGVRLADASLPSPRRMRGLLASTGVRLPARSTSGWCLVALALGVALPILAWANGHGAVALAAVPICSGAVRLDQGRWSGDWATLGSLSRATAALSHRVLVAGGARHSPASVWNSLRTLLSGYGISSRDIAPSTRLLG